MVAYAMEHMVSTILILHGGYHNGNLLNWSQKDVKQISKGKLFILLQFPSYDLSNMDKVEEIF